ncbi:hypothetical protein SVIO_005380 [Streptomyces violaceusniger]|uniref:Amidohydrolase-related domain-containing protein n=1 Tax=Streptomyces violaceusniger TaxID=68280 RepID=A0A4D4KLW7_STRVO|nr:hypothetical protein SVIO_005380 [Streptomyces violaceusniger]
MEIIDAHLHLPRPWSQWKHGDEAFLDLQTELLLGQMDAAGVDAAVIISDPHAAPAHWCTAATARHPDRLATVLVYDETAPDITDQIASARKTPGVLGLRITTAWPRATSSVCGRAPTTACSAQPNNTAYPYAS